MGSDVAALAGAEKTATISIHAPRVGSDYSGRRCMSRTAYFNPRSPCGERHGLRAVQRVCGDFNPRSPCGERPIWHGVKGKWLNFNPRSPCGERRAYFQGKGIPAEFQSTLPVWGATRRSPVRSRPKQYFNPRSPCGERQITSNRASPAKIFQSTLPVWGATRSCDTR